MIFLQRIMLNIIKADIIYARKIKYFTGYLNVCSVSIQSLNLFPKFIHEMSFKNFKNFH